MKKKLILCLLENAWGRGHERIKVFRVNPDNCSGKRMLKITDGHDMWFGNVAPMWMPKADVKTVTCLKHTERVLECKDWDMVIICGKPALEAVHELYEEGAKVFEKIKRIIAMPHPASRTLTNKLCDAVREEIIDSVEDVLFVQNKGSYSIVQMFKDNTFNKLNKR